MASITAPTALLGDRWCRIEGEESYAATGIGPTPATDTTIVFVHGVTSGAVYYPVAERLAPTARVWVPDLPGVGRSAGQAPPLDVRGYCRFLVDWMDAVGIEAAHFVGPSFGASIVIELAALWPERVQSLLVQGLALPPERRRLSVLAPRWILNSIQERPKSQALSQGQKEITPAALKHLIGQMLTHRMEDRFDQVRCPALVLQAGRDALVSERWARGAAGAMPKGEFVLVKGATHSMPAQATQQFSEALQRFTQTRTLEVQS